MALSLTAVTVFAPAPIATSNDAMAGASPEARFRVVLGTERGEFRLVFDPATAPQAVAALRHALAQGGFVGTSIGWVRPHTQIRTGAPDDAPAEVASELDASALGLQQQRIDDAGAAMNAIQFELEPAFMRAGGQASPQLREWIATWRRHFDAEFLVGVSRQQINEALGYRYRPGYASRPVRRANVALVPAKPGSTTLALAILLRDQPRHDGQWVVVGEVESGLELAESLSIAPRLHPKSSELEHPVRITRTEVTSLLPD